MASLPSGFNFSCTVPFPDGSSGVVLQAATKRGERQDMTFFVNVHPLNAKKKKKSVSGSLHLSGSSLRNLDDCPGETRTERLLS